MSSVFMSYCGVVLEPDTRIFNCLQEIDLWYKAHCVPLNSSAVTIYGKKQSAIMNVTNQIALVHSGEGCHVDFCLRQQKKQPFCSSIDRLMKHILTVLLPSIIFELFIFDHAQIWLNSAWCANIFMFNSTLFLDSMWFLRLFNGFQQYAVLSGSWTWHYTV